MEALASLLAVSAASAISAQQAPIPQLSAEPHPPVCRACGCCPRGRGTPVFHPFRFPLGLDYYRELPCEPPAELGRNHTLLAVTHHGGPNKGPLDSGGLWFYYAHGCSDLMWDVGRTVLARNRAHAAVIIQQWRHGGTERDAVNAIAEWVRRHHASWRAIAKAQHVWQGSVERLIAEAARGALAQLRTR